MINDYIERDPSSQYLIFRSIFQQLAQSQIHEFLIHFQNMYFKTGRHGMRVMTHKKYH